ncbi:MAG TPA: GDP-mannose 4,6-dehydratase [Vicinamibacterales bacterium]|jgi:GDP-4-dehydro-6-deoxy-D-mannose reductase
MPPATLVTGAAGFAGSHLLDLLTDSRADDGSNLVGWYRPGGTAPRSSAMKWEAVDILDRSSVVDAVARLRPAVVYHCAGEAHVGQAWERTVATFALNVRGTNHLIDGLSRTGAGARVLIPGSALVYRPASEALTEDHPLIPASPYGVSKLAQELFGSHASASGVQIMIARAFNHFGPRQDPAFSTSGFARQIAAIEAGLQPPEIAVGNLDARRDLTDVRDTVRAYRTIVERGRPGRPYNVCSGRAVAIGEVLERLVARARVPIRVHVDPARFRPNDVPLLLGDPSRLRDELDWKPTVPLDQTLDDILQYWRRDVR